MGAEMPDTNTEDTEETDSYLSSRLDEIHAAMLAAKQQRSSSRASGGLLVVEDSETFAERLLHEHQVAVVPGHVFGPSGEGHVRCSYATALPLLEEALERMGRFLASAG